MNVNKDIKFQIAQAARKKMIIEEGSYLAYLKYVHNGNYMISPHNALIASYLEKMERKEIQKLMVFLPPRHGKSMTITETFPSYYLLRHPENKVIEVSYSDAFAARFGRKNREKIREHGSDLYNIKLSYENASAGSFSIAGHRKFW